MSMRFEEVSIERSKSFVTALQELKNLRPQLYSAADYCENSYLNSEQKQMVLDNLKDYTIRTLVNAIDHLGTVAYKLSDILEQQTPDISSMDLRVTCLNQRIRTCQTYTEKQGLREQQVLDIFPRHHKHYILPITVNKKVQFSPHIQTDPKQTVQANIRLHPSAAKTIPWHLASETKSTLNGSPLGIMSIKDSNASGKTFEALNLLDAEVNSRKKFAPATIAMKTLGITRRETWEGSKPLTPYRSFTNTPQREIFGPPVRSKSMLSGFFAKQKTPKVKSNSGKKIIIFSSSKSNVR
ncbi:hypothetical protein OROGR_013450 [Orobanche gracilis]